ncbi:hypothetical protein LINGRAHAP2_LOCUS30091, partial [Linum grandiflorum]
CEAETRAALGGRRANETVVNKDVHKKIVGWFHQKILSDSTTTYLDYLMMLAGGPQVRAGRYTTYDIN